MLVVDPLFIFKKLVAGWTSPLSLSLLIIGLGIIMLLANHRRRALFCITSGWLALLVLAMPPVADWWLAPREQAIAITAVPTQPIKAVVVLGCSFEVIHGAPASSWLTRCAARRVLQGVIEWQRHPDTLMVFTGGNGYSPTIAESMATVALELGVPPAQVRTLTNAPDTAAEAAGIAKMIDGPVMLVTSASHMQRALGYFQAAGVAVIPSPADHLASPDYYRNWYGYSPKAEQLIKAERAWYEQLGLLWQALGGK